MLLIGFQSKHTHMLRFAAHAWGVPVSSMGANGHSCISQREIRKVAFLQLPGFMSHKTIPLTVG